MRGLLDVNVLVAVFDPDHVFHGRAHDWLSAEAGLGIATCPLTENGFVRILSSPGYSASLRLPPSDIIQRLLDFTSRHDHEFWPDSLSLRDPVPFVPRRILGARQITDIYLLALAASREGCLVTFDPDIPVAAAAGARSDHLKAI